MWLFHPNVRIVKDEMVTLKEISSKTNLASLVSVVPEYFAFKNEQAMTQQNTATELQKRFGLSDAAAAMLAGIIMDSTIASGLGSAVGEAAERKLQQTIPEHCRE